MVLFANAKEVDRIEGTEVVELVNKVKQSIIKHYPLVANIGSGETTSKSSIETRLKELINSSDLMIFMKGSRVAPRYAYEVLNSY